MTRRSVYAFVGFLLVVSAGQAAGAWEICLKDAVRLSAAVVRLSDVADLTGLDDATEAALGKMLLVPGPTASRSRVLIVSQVRGILQRQGVDLERCRFSGASRVVVSFGSSHSKSASPTKSTSTTARVDHAGHRTTNRTTTVEEIQQQLEEVVEGQLMRLSGDAEPWKVDATVGRRALLEVPKDWNDVTVEGLERPVEGNHSVVACFGSREGEVRVPLTVHTRRLTRVVVPVRQVERGQMISAGDVELRFIDGGNNVRNAVGRLEDVVGRQASQPLPAGKPVASRSIKEPILVRRRELIEVVARSGLIKITRRAMALDAGARGDTISVETLDGDKDRFIARVVGPGQAEVFVSSPTVPHETGGKNAKPRPR